MPNVTAAFPFFAFTSFGRSLITATGLVPSAAALITTPITEVNSASPGAGVILPAAINAAPPNGYLQPYVVANFTGNYVLVYPPTGLAIVGYGTNVGYPLPAWSSITFQGEGAGIPQISAFEPYTIPAGSIPQ
jgi:hypothetical protein